MQIMQTQMAAQVTQVTHLFAGLSGFLEGDSSSQRPSHKEDKGELGSSVSSVGTQPPVSETLGTSMFSMASLSSDLLLTQSSSGIHLLQVSLSDQWNISRSHGINIMWVWKPRSDNSSQSD